MSKICVVIPDSIKKQMFEVPHDKDETNSSLYLRIIIAGITALKQSALARPDVSEVKEEGQNKQMKDLYYS